LRALEEEAAAPRHAVLPPAAENSQSESESEREGQAEEASQTHDDFLWCDDFSVVLTYEEWHVAWHGL